MLVNNIKRILTNKRLSTFKSTLGRKHAVDLIFLLYLDKGHHKEAKLFMCDLGLPFSDGAYYARMKELVSVGLAKSVPIDSKRKYFIITKVGEEVAERLLEFFEKLEE